MEKIARGLLIGSAIAAASLSHAQMAKHYGVPDCGRWLSEKPPSVSAAAYRYWLIGYLSGINRIWKDPQGQQFDPLNALASVDQAYLWMDNYCRANPLQDLSEGAGILFVELVEKEREKQSRQKKAP